MLYKSAIRNTLRVLLVPLAAVVMAACSDDDDPTGPDNQAPVARIEASPLTVPAGDANQTVVTIDASESSDPDGNQLSYSWTVPNGTFVNGTTASDAIIEVTFPGTAPYVVTVTVSDANGGTDSAQVTIGID